MIDKRTLGIVGFQGDGNNPFSGENISLEVINQGTAAEDRLLAISAGWYDKAADIKDFDGNVCDAILADGTFINTTNKEVSARGKNCKVADTVKMFSNTPCRIKGIKLYADDTDQLDEEIQILRLTPNGPQVVKRIVPSSSKDEGNNDALRVSIDLTDDMITIGEDTTFLLKLAAGRKCTYTIYYENRASFRQLIESNVYGK